MSETKGGRARRIVSDSLWSISGLVLMNVIAQFVVYPAWNRTLGSESYGSVLYMMSLINVVGISAGVSCNYARMKNSVNGETSNAHYIVALGIVSALMVPFVLVLGRLRLIEMRPGETVLYFLLMCATMWRYYADVEYRLSLNYRGYFVYYAVIGAGYLAGIALFRLTGLWPMALLPGELMGIALVLLRGRALRWNGGFSWREARPVFQAALVLYGSEFLSMLVFNGDRILLNWLDGTAVTSYYLASLLGKTVSLISTPLNGIIIGYLARYKGRMDRKILLGIAGGAAAMILVGTACCTVASHVLISRLYPDNYADVKGLFVIANLAQVIYFTANAVIVTLLRFGKPYFNIIINGIYAVVFCALCIPMTAALGLNGFCKAILLTCAIRLLAALILCVRQSRIQKTNEEGTIGDA